MTQKTEIGPLDTNFSTWSERISDRIDPDLRAAARGTPWFRNPVIRITLNERAVSFRGGDDRAAPQLLDAPETDALLKALRAEMSPQVWPFCLEVVLEGLDRRDPWRVIPHLTGVGLAGLPLEAGTGGLLTRNGYGRSLIGLDRVAEAGALLTRLTPPSNGPVRGWSRVSDMMGSTHVHYQAVHARSEPEALLKLILVQEGLGQLTAMAQAGRIEMRDGPFRTWFTSTDLEDLDIDPEGRPVSREAALDRLNLHLSEPDPSEPTP